MTFNARRWVSSLLRSAWARRPRPPKVRDVALFSAQTTLKTAKFFCFIHLCREHILDINGSSGTSMLPTLALDGDSLLYIRLPILRLWNDSTSRITSLLSSSSSSSTEEDQRVGGGRYVGGARNSSKFDQSQGTGLRIGDLVVALSPANPDRTVCKRVVGLPGDTVCVDPRMRPLPEESWRGRRPSSSLSSSPTGAKLEGGNEHSTATKTTTTTMDEVDLLESMDSQLPHSRDASTALHNRAVVPSSSQVGLRTRGTVQYVTVPRGHVWLTGDNLSNSTDSRHYGPVPMGLIRGKVVARAFPDPGWLGNNMRTTPTSPAVSDG